MSDIKINGAGVNAEISQLKPKTKSGAEGKNFGEILEDSINKLNQVQNDADKAVKELSQGGDATQALIAMSKAEMSFQLMIEVRNRLLSAYDEIQRTQV